MTSGIRTRTDLSAMVCALLSTAALAGAQSLDTTFNPGANAQVSVLLAQADGKILVGGAFTTLGGGGTGTTTRNRIGRLNADGSLDTTFDPGANGDVSALAVQADGRILVGGAFTMLGGGGTGTTTRNRIGRLNADGSLDTSFDPGTEGVVKALAVQADGRILVGGMFNMLGGGGTGTTQRYFLGRLNADGSLDSSFNPGANNFVWAIAVQADGKILVGGAFTRLGGGGTGTTTRNCLGRLNADGSLDTSFDPGANTDVSAFALQRDGKILVGGAFTTLGGGGTGATTRNRIGRLNADGSLDPAFDPGANGWIFAVAVQADGKIVVGGYLTALGGGTGTTARSYLGRLGADGSLDLSFNPGADNYVYSVAAQPDGKILAAGEFTWLGGGGTGTTQRSRIGRLNADGSLDMSFDPGANGQVYALAAQADGKILVGGTFTTLGGGGAGTASRSRIGRLNADGSLDTSFDAGANNTVWALAMQADGKILVGGNFSMLGGGGIGTTPRNWIGRLNGDGSIDPSLNPGANSTVQVLTVQPDGKILVGGGFTRLGPSGPTAPRYLGRLNADGSLDTSFNPGANGWVYALAVQADGKILVGGSFTTLGGGGTGTTTRNRIGRLNADGSLDTSFDPGASATVYCLALQADGKILVGGSFTTLGGGGTGTTPSSRIGRLNADGSLDTTFDPGASFTVQALAVQADGKIVVGGVFTMLGGGGTGATARNYLGRLNADGSLDMSFDPGANSYVYAVAAQPTGQSVVGGVFTMLGGGGTGATPRNYIGRLKATPVVTWANPAAITYGTALGAAQLNATASVAGTFVYTPANGTILPVGSGHALWVTFVPADAATYSTVTTTVTIDLIASSVLDTRFNPGASGQVLTLAVQTNGKVVVGGGFTTLGGGGTGTTPRDNLGRLNADGSLDTSFNPGLNSPVRDVVVQADGKIVIGGSFTALSGGGGSAGPGVRGQGATPRSRIARLNEDGSLDTSFDPGANADVNTLAVQPDGRILSGGDFTTLGGGGDGTTVRNHLGRLNPDGSPDTSFDPGANGAVAALAVQADGKILVGGSFTALGGGTGTTARSRIGRLNDDGSPDTSFDPGANNTVLVLAVQPDGKILVGGDFSALGGGGAGTTPRSYLGRLNPDGSPDTSFDPGANGAVRALAVQEDGKILVGGDFTTLGGGGAGATPRHHLGRLNADGSLDASFSAGADDAVMAVAVQPDGEIVVGGSFTEIDGGGGDGTTPRSYIGRLKGTPVITWANPASIVSGTALAATQLNATASVAGTFVYTPASGTVLSVGARQTLSVTFEPTDTDSYTTATATVTIDVKAPVPTFTNAPLAAGVTVKAVHLTELRQAVEALRTWYLLTAPVWTDATIAAGVTPAKAAHVAELRTALDAVYAAAGRTAPTYTHGTVTAGAIITAIDIAELRAAIVAVW